MNPNRRRIAAAVAIAASFLMSACATVTRGTKESLVVETDPRGALAEVDGQRGRTPTTFKLSRKFEGPVYISKTGYEPVTVHVTSQVAIAGGAGMAGNVLIGGVIGAGVDVATGSTNELKPNPIFVKLYPVARTESQPPPQPAPPPVPADPMDTPALPPEP